MGTPTVPRPGLLPTALPEETPREKPATDKRANEGAVVARGLRKVYREDTVAVDQLDIEVFRGELFGLLGPNGAGKTTTIGILTTRVLPTVGEARIGGFSVRTQAVPAKQLMGVVTQFNTLDRRLTAWENLYYHGRYFGLARRDAREQAARILDLFQLTEKRNSFVDELSGGMQQRLLIGRALVHRPEVLFLDEPTAGIDPQGRLALHDILRGLHRDGLTILLTTHDMEEAEALCQRVAIMDSGRILALGTPEELKSSLDSSTVITLQAKHVDEGLLAAIRMLPGVRKAVAATGGVDVHVASAHGLLPQILETALRQGIRVTDMSVRAPSLETVFINLTGRALRD